MIWMRERHLTLIESSIWPVSTTYHQYICGPLFQAAWSSKNKNWTLKLKHIGPLDLYKTTVSVSFHKLYDGNWKKKNVTYRASSAWAKGGGGDSVIVSSPFRLSLFPADHQPLHLWHRAAAGQHLPQKAGGQEVAQHGQSELHQEELQAVAGGQEHAGYCQKGMKIENETRALLPPSHLSTHAGTHFTYAWTRSKTLFQDSAEIWGDANF